MTVQNNTTPLGLEENILDDQFLNKIEIKINQEKDKFSRLQNEAKSVENNVQAELQNLKVLHSELDILWIQIRDNYQAYQTFMKKAQVEKKILSYSQKILIAQKGDLHIHDIADYFVDRIKSERKISHGPVFQEELNISVDNYSIYYKPYSIFDEYRRYYFADQNMEILDEYEKRRALAFVIALEVCKEVKSRLRLKDDELTHDGAYRNGEYGNANIAIKYSEPNPKYQPDNLNSWGM